jgi:hypothetical protein
MAVDGDDLLINRSFGRDLHRYSLTKWTAVPPPAPYWQEQQICVTNIRLNSKKILAMAISLGQKQMIDLVNLNTDRLIHRIGLDSSENILYPVDLHNAGQWFAKTCTPCVNIGHCLISSDGGIHRLNLFPKQDNFIRSIRVSADKRWLLVSRQHALEIYQVNRSLVPSSEEDVGFVAHLSP